MRATRFAALALTVFMLFAGQVPAQAGPMDDPYAPSRAALAKVPCEASSAVTDDAGSDNVKALRKLPWPGPDVSSGEIDIHGNVLVAFYREALGNGIITYDISDPDKPKQLAKFSTGANTPYDVKITSDGKTAVIGYGADVASVVVGYAGVIAVDISDPARPKLTDDWISPRPGPTQNGHMVFTERIDRQHWVFIAPNEGSGAWILKLNGPPEKRTFEYVTVTFPVEGGFLGPHDIFVQKDKVLDKWVLYAADGYHGWLAFDISNPASPLPLGGFAHPATGYTHTIQARMIGGRRIVATIEEVGANLLKVYDATNLAAPIPLGVWYQKAGTGPAEAQHNLQMVGKYLYIAHYDRGFYVFDISSLEGQPLSADLQPMAHYMDGESVIWDVVIRKGLMYLTSYPTGGGLHVVGFGCVTPGNRRANSTG
ncbi:MAG TPA: hypothetical protein VNC78_07850 [Actinomycetota bacterium]|nr:hypothetical protein [Actinomycetota bacterium]